MRMYKKISETADEVRYAYLWGDYTLPYSGEISIQKDTGSARLIKKADLDTEPSMSVFIASKILVQEQYPQQRTHTAA